MNEIIKDVTSLVKASANFIKNVTILCLFIRLMYTETSEGYLVLEFLTAVTGVSFSIPKEGLIE